MERLPLKERIALSDLRAERAKEMLEDARKTLEGGMFKTSVNRSYYAVLHATRSVLILRGIDTLKEEENVKLFSLGFVERELISKEMLRILRGLLYFGKEVDYRDIFTVEEEDARKVLEEAEKFVKEIFSLRDSIIKEMKEY